MHPVLIRIGPLTLHTYGLAIASAFLAGMALAVRQAKKEGEEPQKIFDLIFYLMVAAIVGARLLFVILNYREYIHNPLQALKIWEGGLVYYGGLLAALGVGVWLIRRYNLSLGKTADILAPSVALGQAIGRIGCFMAGCCYGKPTHVAWAVTFTDAFCLAPTGIPLHPTQLYASAMALIIFGLLLLIRRRRTFLGQVFLSYVVLYAIGRFILEFFRGDKRGFVHIWGWLLSTSQVISLGAFIVAIALLAVLMRRQISA